MRLPHPSSRRRWSLRTQLLVTLIGLLALVCLVVGVVTEVALQHFLVGRLDSQLQAALGRSSAAAGDGLRPPMAGDVEPNEPDRPDHPDGPDGGRPGFLLAPGQAVGTLGARIVGGTVRQSGVLDTAGTAQPVAGEKVAELSRVPVDGRPHTADLGSLGDYRLIAQRMPDGDVLVTGLPLNGVRSTTVRLAAAEAAVAVLALLAAGLLGATIVRRTLRPLDRVAATAGRVATLPLDRGEVALAERVSDADTNPRTEVGQVGTALNQLLNHVTAALNARQRSETQVRQFVADASHELRTPLAAIRGYAELTRHSADSTPSEVIYALNRVESEAERMTALVEDLLLLARLDAGRPLTDESVDLVPLLVHAVSDAHAAGPGHGWELDLPDEPAAVRGDEARLHQVVANLLANARTHTPAGTTVRVRIRSESEQVVLSVTDDGPGIPAQLQPKIFERFARGDESRSRTAGSTGLGLAIVDAVVGAHGGTTDVSSEPGHTVFTVRLPAAPVELAAGAPDVV